MTLKEIVTLPYPAKISHAIAGCTLLPNNSW